MSAAPVLVGIALAFALLTWRDRRRLGGGPLRAHQRAWLTASALLAAVGISLWVFV